MTAALAAAAPPAPVTLETFRDIATSPRVSLQSRVRQCTAARHHGPARTMDDIDMIVMHSTAGASAMSSIEYLNTTSEKIASYAYVIDRDGTIWRMCSVTLTAYHAGDSAWPAPKHYPPGNGGHSVNRRSIGIAWANMDDGEQLTRAQVESALWLVSVYVSTGHVAIDHVAAHRDVSPGRKVDPVPETMPMDVWRELLKLYLRIQDE